MHCSHLTCKAFALSSAHSGRAALNMPQKKLQTPKMHYTSVTHSDLVLHMSNKSTVQLENGTGIKKKMVYAS